MIVEFQCEHFWNSSQSHQRIKSAFNSSEWNTIFRIKITDKSDYTFVCLWLNGVFVWLCAISVRKKKKNSSQLKIWYVFYSIHSLRTRLIAESIFVARMLFFVLFFLICDRANFFFFFHRIRKYSKVFLPF